VSAADIIERAKALFAEISALPDGDRMDAVNEIRLALHEHSPMKAEPIDCVLWIKSEAVRANDYNPNSVAPPEMRLLQLSIQADGYTQPIVAMADPEGGYEIVDGFHRHRVGREVGAVRKRVQGRLPMAVINTDRSGKEDRMAATIRHNRARGKHSVDAMAEMVVDLTRRGWSPAKIATELGMDADEVLRLRQVTGLAAAFADREFSKAWE
jgi:ParB-like chromosome segregation protein Spo0J